VSPEVASGNYYSFEVDIWAIGVLAFELTVGVAPFYDPGDLKDKQATLAKIIKVGYRLVLIPAQGEF
jgi:serine/threonine protein kinase